MKLRNILSFALSSSFAFTPALHAAKQKLVEVHRTGTTSMAVAITRDASVQSAAKSSPGYRAILKAQPKPVQAAHGALAQTNRSLSTGLAFKGFPIVGPDGDFTGFDALDSGDFAAATGFVAEPPDQGLATNGNQVLEAVNDVIRVFTNSGKPLTPTASLYSFFNVPTAPDSNGNTFQLTDPRAFYDWESGHWFVSILEYTANVNGAPTGGSTVLLAVSANGDAVGNYVVNSIDVSDANFGACPCLGDQPLLGLNQDGVYLNTNEYSNTTGFFQTALVTAISKSDLIKGASTVVAAGFDGLTLAESVAFSVQPAFPSPGTKTNQNLGTEFFTSSLDFNNSVDNRLAVWSLTNTQSLKDPVPNLNLQLTVINTQEYGAPVPAVQRSGAYPQGMALGDPEELIDAGDDRMMQLFYSNGKLYCGVTTLLLEPKGSNGPRSGAAWFEIEPDASYTSLSAKVTKQGLIGIANGSVMYPAFAVNSAGEGVIAFSFTSPDYFPSTGYVNFQNGVVQPEVHLAGIGQAPDDGFTGYPQYTGGNVARWGDYSAAMVSPNGDLWMAAEYIPNPVARPRTQYTNWGTFIYQVK